MIQRRYKVNIPRNNISSLRKQLKADKQLHFNVSNPPKSDKTSPRVNVVVKANVYGITEIELVESTIKFNDGVIIDENHTGKLSKKIECIESVKKSWFKLILLYSGLVGSNTLTRIPDIDTNVIPLILIICIPISLGLFYGRNILSTINNYS